MIDLLGSHGYGHAAASALITCGEPVLGSLEIAFHRSGQQDLIRKRIVQIYSRIGGNKALDLLWDKMDDPDKRIVKQVIYAYRYWNYRLPQERVSKVIHLLETEIGKTVWNLAALDELGNSTYTVYLREAMEEEVRGNFDMIYMVLSLLYDPTSILLVRENVEAGTADGITYAIELLDVFLAKDLKPQLFPLLDDIGIDEKVEALQLYFPRERYDEYEVLVRIINRDYNQTNRWTKACALYALYHTEGFAVHHHVMAHLFNPDVLIREMAAWVSYHANRQEYNEVTKRLSYDDRKELSDIMRYTHPGGIGLDTMPLRFEKVLFLQGIPLFEGIPGQVLSELVDLIKVRRFTQGKWVIAKGESGNTPLYIVANGELHRLAEDGGVEEVLEEMDMFGYREVLGTDVNHYSIVAGEDTTLFMIEKAAFFELLAEHYEMMEVFLHSEGGVVRTEVFG